MKRATILIVATFVWAALGDELSVLVLAGIAGKGMWDLTALA